MCNTGHVYLHTAKLQDIYTNSQTVTFIKQLSVWCNQTIILIQSPTQYNSEIN